MTDAGISCVTCPILRPAGRPRRPNRMACCDGCRERLATMLAELPGLFAGLDEHLEPGRGGAEIRPKGFESQPPLSITALSLRAQGSMLPATEGRPLAQDQLGDVPPLERLWWWCEDWAQTLRHGTPPPNMEHVCGWLRRRLPWACDNHPAIDEFTTDLRAMSGAIRAITGGDRGEKVGRCPQTLTDGTRCNTQLFVDPYVDIIKCSRCSMEWRRRDGQWLHLRGQQIAAGVEAA